MPTLSKPPAGIHGHPLWDSWHELDSFGYRQHEYLVSGTARALDGTTAPYTTRIIVFRPDARSRFNGTVMLDWVNVTAQFENAVDTLEAREMLLREGWAYVHVSAQKAGLCCIAADAAGLRPGAVRRDQPPRRPVLRRHVQPDRPGDAVAPGPGPDERA